MNRITEPLHAAAAHTPEPQPIVLALILSLKLREVFPQVRQSASLLVQWLRAQLGLQRDWHTEAEQLVEELEQQRALITRCLANDAPRDRRHIEAALDAIHAHQLTHAAHLAPPAPARLLQD